MSNGLEISGATLGELHEHLQALFDTYEMVTDEELKQQAEADIERYLEAEIRKVDAVAGYLSGCENNIGFLKAEIVRLRDRIDMWERRNQRVRDYVKFVMERAGERKLEGKASTFFLRAAAPTVVIMNEQDIPDEFKESIIQTTINKRAVRAAIESGQDVPGADLALGGQTLVRR